MPLQKLTATDAFVITDIADAPCTGIVRAGKKILQSSAADLARSVSYTFASLEIQRGGASAGINAVDDALEPAIAAFCEELEEVVRSGDLHLDPGKGTTVESLAPLLAAADRPPAAGTDAATVEGVVAAATWVSGGSLDGRKLAIEGDDPMLTLLAEALTAAGGQLVEVAGADTKPWLIWGADADLILAGSKPGALTHQGAPMVKADGIVPWGPIPFTTKAFAELHRAGKVMVPDFLSAAGATMAGYLPGSTTVTEAVTGALEASQHDDGLFLGACRRAEAFLATWLDESLFGRPLAA